MRICSRSTLEKREIAKTSLAKSKGRFPGRGNNTSKTREKRKPIVGQYKVLFGYSLEA